MNEDYPRDALKPGHLLLWYKIDRVLGEGGFGITYLAHDVNLDKKVAIKEYLPTDMCQRKDDHTIAPNTNTMDDFESGLNRFIREARTLAKFEHPNVVKVSNVFEENGTAYMAMAYEKGKDLKTLLSPRKTITEDHILSIILPILDGLEYVHDSGFIHRDIKPGNIMIREDGSPVLIDFGSVHDTKKAKENVTTLVSPGFTPHEQYVGKPELQGPWTDIYSLGATLYRCVYGINPIDAITRGSALIKRESDPLQAASKLGQSKYSTCLLEAIDHAMAFDEKERPQDVLEWRDELVGECEDKLNDTLNEGNNLLRSMTRSHSKNKTIKPDRTVDLKTTTVINPEKKSPLFKVASIAAVALLSTIVFITNNKEESKEFVKDMPIKNTSSTQVSAINSITSTVNSEEDIKTEGLLPITDILEGEIKDKLKDGSAAPTLVIIPSGSNIIGSDENEEGHRNDEMPKTLITIKKSIAIGKTEVTVGEFRKFIDATGYVTSAEADVKRGCRTNQQGSWDWTVGTSWAQPGYEQQDSHPVVCVSWMDAMAYVNWLSTETGKRYQLPSESTWEYATRAGTTTSRFWGEEGACEYSNVSDFSRAAMHGLDISSQNIFPCEDGNTYSSTVASFKPNQFGLYDTIGNVWEWTVDCWNKDYSSSNNDGAPRLDGNCNNRVYRGGSWGNLPTLVRAAKRLTDPTHYRYYNLGFRISRTIDS